VDPSAAVGFKEIRLSVRIETDAPDEQVDAMVRMAERCRVVLQSIVGRTPVRPMRK